MKRKPCKKIIKEQNVNIRASADYALLKNITNRPLKFNILDALLQMKKAHNHDRKQTEKNIEETNNLNQTQQKRKRNNWTNKQNEKQHYKKTYKNSMAKTNNDFQKHFSHNGGFKTNKKYCKKYLYSKQSNLGIQDKNKQLNIQGIKFDKTNKIQDKRSDLQIEIEHKQKRRVKALSFQKVKLMKTYNKYSCPSQQKQQMIQFSPNISKHNSTHSVFINSINIQCKKYMPFGKQAYSTTNHETNDAKIKQIWRNFKMNTDQRTLPKRKRDKGLESQSHLRSKPYKSQQDLQKSIFITSK